jgi:hypothetical protein
MMSLGRQWRIVPVDRKWANLDIGGKQSYAYYVVYRTLSLAKLLVASVKLVTFVA